MFNFGNFSPAALALSLVLVLAACDTAEERAEEHYQSGLELMEAGDVDRAIVEFRNVFKLDANHLEARRALGRLFLDIQKDDRRAYRQFLRIAEQHPDDLEARIILSEIGIKLGNWEEVDRHATRAQDLDPENPRVKAVALARVYRTAVLDEDQAAIRDVARQAVTMLEEQPENGALRAIRVDANLRDANFEQALEDIDWMLERDENNLQILQQRLSILAQLGDDDGIETQLKDMIARFPENDAQKATLLRFYMSREKTDKAEAYLRELASETDDPQPKVDLVRFLMEVRGTDAAEAEVKRLIAESADPLPFHLLAAAITFDQGKQQEAIAGLEDVLNSAPEGADVGELTVALAQMQLSVGNEVGARARVEEVLAKDPQNPQALKMQAAWLIEADDTETAIANLRSALDSQPEDAQAMSLMAQAYDRAGQAALAQDFLALAVEASGNAPAETMRYARLLMQQENYLSAEDVLLTALRLAPQDLNLVSTLGELYLAKPDPGRLQQVISTLRAFETPEAQQVANNFEAARINQQNGTSEALSFLENLSQGADASLVTRLNLVRARLQTGDVQGALEEARAMKADNPDNPVVASVAGTTEALAGNIDVAETAFRDIVTKNPQAGSQPWLQLAQMQVRRGSLEAGAKIIDEALTHLPENARLLWAKASYLENFGDIDGAITIYESLYERNSSSTIVANNLASLLSTYRQDEGSLERSWTIARRFRDTEVPAMQDTYGWILKRRGETEEALPYLQAAAEALSEEPIVQYHLGETYLALGQVAEALAQYRKVVDLANPADQRDQVQDAREKLANLKVPEDNSDQ